VKRTVWVILVFALAAGFAPGVQALQNDWGVDENDWTVVSGGWAGSAGGMTSCTARQYCTDCAQPINGGSSICAKAYRNAYCNCGYFYISGIRYCKASGACTYKPT
jgi:hypothetical protein